MSAHPKAAPADLGTIQRLRWENATRWYEAELLFDLLGDCVITRRWGGKGARYVGQMTVVVTDVAEGERMLERLHQQRLKRAKPYRLVSVARRHTPEAAMQLRVAGSRPAMRQVSDTSMPARSAASRI